MTHLGANVSDDLARLSGKVEDAFAYADGAVSKNIGKHNARVYQSNGGNWDEVASGILGGSGAGRKAAAEFSDDASQALAKHGDEVSRALKETDEQAGKHASAEFGGETSEALAKHGDEVSQALKETGEQSGKRASTEFSGEASVNTNEGRGGLDNKIVNSDEIIRDGSHFDELGNLKPNVKYQSGEFEYLYQTDDIGRVTEWDAPKLNMTQRDTRLSHDSNTPGKLPGDHAGHLAGDRFGGSPEIDNLVSQLSGVNLSDYKKLENQWAKALKAGEDVSVNVKVNYVGDSLRPDSFEVGYSIDGDYTKQFIKNMR